MCFNKMLSVAELEIILKDLLFVKAVLILRRVEYKTRVSRVLVHNKTQGLFEIDYNSQLNSVGDIGNLYSKLYRDYGYCSIIKFS